jgi:glycerol-3-phosphate cytidylyltransferase
MGLRIVTAGTFDLIHSGHVNFLRECAQFGEVIVVLNTDKFIERYKGKPPVMTYEERYQVLSELRSVTEVFPNWANENCATVVDDLCPDVLAIGSDWARKDYYKQMGFDQDWLDARNIKLLYIPYAEGISTTDIKRRLQG